MFKLLMTEISIEDTLIDPISAVNIDELETSEAGRKAALICRSAQALKAHDITVLDVRGQTIIADFFVLCSGTSTTHIHSIAGHVQDTLREHGMRAKPEGDSASLWVVMDYGDTILHVLGEETREFYDLERLWADANVTAWPEGRERQKTEDQAD